MESSAGREAAPCNAKGDRLVLDPNDDFAYDITRGAGAALPSVQLPFYGPRRCLARRRPGRVRICRAFSIFYIFDLIVIVFPGPLRQRSVPGLGPSFFYLLVACLFLSCCSLFTSLFDLVFDGFPCFR